MINPMLSDHARRRMNRRGINDAAVCMVLEHGREVYTRGATIYAVGNKEVAHAKRDGINLRDFKGLQIVFDNTVQQIVTVYRNHDFKLLKPSPGRKRYNKKE